MTQESPRQTVRDSLMSAGVPEVLCEGILAILVDAGYYLLKGPVLKKDVLAKVSNVEKNLPRLVDQMALLRRAASYEAAQMSHQYTRLAMSEHKRLQQSRKDNE